MQSDEEVRKVKNERMAEMKRMKEKSMNLLTEKKTMVENLPHYFANKV